MGLCSLLLGLSEVRVVPSTFIPVWDVVPAQPHLGSSFQPFVTPLSILSHLHESRALTVELDFFFSNKGHFHSQFYLKYPLRGFLWRNSPFSWGGKACRVASIGKVSGQALLSPPFVLGGSLIKGESIWWWLIICPKEQQRDVSKPQSPGWLSVGRMHSLGMQAERRCWAAGL